MSWAVVVGAIAAAALSVTVWLKVHPVKSRAVDAGSGGALATVGSDATVVTAMRAEAPPVRTEAPVVAAPPPPPASAAPPITPQPRHPVPPAPPPRHAPAQDAGAPPPSCNPPWFLDSAGHKQYKPECF